MKSSKYYIIRHLAHYMEENKLYLLMFRKTEKLVVFSYSIFISSDLGKRSFLIFLLSVL